MERNFGTSLRGRYKNWDSDRNYISPFEAEVLRENSVDQYTHPSITPLNSEDAMERYQMRMLHRSTPEQRLPSDEDKVEGSRNLFKYRSNLMTIGNSRGDPVAAYKPELVQTNTSRYYGGYIEPNNESRSHTNMKQWNFANRAMRNNNVKKVEQSNFANDYEVNRPDKTLRNRWIRTNALRSIFPFIFIDEAQANPRQRGPHHNSNTLYNKYVNREYGENMPLYEVMTMASLPKKDIDSSRNRVRDLLSDTELFISSPIQSEQAMRSKEVVHNVGNLEDSRIHDQPYFSTDDKIADPELRSKRKQIASGKSDRSFDAEVADPIIRKFVMEERIKDIMSESIKAIKEDKYVNKRKAAPQIFRDSESFTNQVTSVEEQSVDKDLKRQGKKESKAFRIKVVPMHELVERVASVITREAVPDDVKIGAQPIISDNYSVNPDKEGESGRKRSKVAGSTSQTVRGLMNEMAVNYGLIDGKVRNKESPINHGVLHNELFSDETGDARNFANTHKYNQQAKKHNRNFVSNEKATGEHVLSETMQYNGKPKISNKLFGKERFTKEYDTVSPLEDDSRMNVRDSRLG